MSLYIICYALVALQKSTKQRKFELYRFKVYLFTLHKIRVRLSADACTRLDNYDFNFKSGSSPHCDCVQSITVEQWTHFLNSKHLRKLFIDVENALSTNQAMSHDYMNSYILNFTI